MEYISSFLGYTKKQEENDLDDKLNDIDFSEKDANNILTQQVNQALGMCQEPEEEDVNGESSEEEESDNDEQSSSDQEEDSDGNKPETQAFINDLPQEEEKLSEGQPDLAKEQDSKVERLARKLAKTERKLAKTKEQLARQEAGIDDDEEDSDDSSDDSSSEDEESSEDNEEAKQQEQPEQEQSLDIGLSDTMIKIITKRMDQVSIKQPVEGEQTILNDKYRMMLYSFLSLDDIKNTILKLSKSEQQVVMQNCKMLEDVKTERKVVLHFNSQYKDDFEEGVVSIEQIEMIINISQIVVIEMDWGTFDQYKFGDQEANQENEQEDDNEKELDVIGQMTKFAFDQAVGNMKKVGVVVFIESKLTLPKVEKMCQFLTTQIDASINYGNMVQTLELIIGEYQNEDSDTESATKDDKSSESDKTDSRCYGNIILKLLSAFRDIENSQLNEVRLTRQTMYDGALLRSDQLEQAVETSSEMKCQKVYFDATILQSNDIQHLSYLFPNSQKIILEAENIYTSQIDVTYFNKLRNLDLIVTPSESYPTLLSGKIDDTDDSENKFKILYTKEQESTLALKVDLSSFFSHDLTYLLWHFGTKHNLSKLRINVGKLIIKQGMVTSNKQFKNDDLYQMLEKVPFGPDFKTYQFLDAKYVFLLINSVKDSKYQEFPFEFVYARHLEDEDSIQMFKIYAEGVEVQVKFDKWPQDSD